MDHSLIVTLQSRFDQLAHMHPESTDLEFWFARDLQEPLGYARWENFMTAIQRAIESCKTTGYEAEHHFRGVTKMVTLGSGAERSIDDFMLTRYACYLIAQNGDPHNGLALSHDAHWMFDKGLWTAVPKGDHFLIHVALGKFTESSPQQRLLATHHQTPLHFPSTQIAWSGALYATTLRPDPIHFDWHRQQHGF